MKKLGKEVPCCAFRSRGLAAVELECLPWYFRRIHKHTEGTGGLGGLFFFFLNYILFPTPLFFPPPLSA